MSNDKLFIEVQFPVSKVSKESYKERKAVQGQTLTGLGKWWGRKPLILVRAALLGLLMPSSGNVKRDREIFLKILMMDDAGLIKRKEKSIPSKVIYEYLTPNERKRYFADSEQVGKIEYKKGIKREDKQELQDIIFKRMSYDEKLEYCLRPEEINNIDIKEWSIVNEHLGTNANSLQSLVSELGVKRFGKVPEVGDCFAGGGSIPFEASRTGFDIYASDLNPIAMLLTWADININGCTFEEALKLKQFQKSVYDYVDQQVTDLGIEQNEEGHRANAYLYCNETICPECGYGVPLATTWIVSKKDNIIAILKENRDKMIYDIEIHSNVSEYQMKQNERNVTIVNGELICPHCKVSTPISVIRKDRRREDGVVDYGLREWRIKDFIPVDIDIFKERLYCIRYEYEYIDDKGNLKVERYYSAPTNQDVEREEKVVSMLKEKFLMWQQKGYIPNSMIELGEETTRLVRERGWKYWHQLFNPRQLLLNGLFMEAIDILANNKIEKVAGLLGANKCANWNSKLSRWDNGKSPSVKDTYYNQALNTLFNYSCRGLTLCRSIWFYEINNYPLSGKKQLKLDDARNIRKTVDFWITDPPYADAVNYHELSEFFLAWDKKFLLDIFPDWYADSKRALAVKGTGEHFNQSMVEVYKNLTNNMNDEGMQVVMFTHQNVSVWANLTVILWTAGLRVSAAWNIATETESGGLKDGNYVKGTVLLILRKQTSEDTAYLDELYPEIEEEVKNQIESMRELDDKEDPNFTDADYLLAAYAASLKVLTSYKRIEDIDVIYELSKTSVSGEESPIVKIISEAVKIAYDYLIPTGFEQYIWKLLIPEERYYIKGLDLEKDGIYQVGAYQELARGFGVSKYRDLLASTKANQARLKTAIEFGMRGLDDSDRFGASVLRNVLAALHQSIKEEDTTKGRNWLKNELPNYWQQRNTIIEILDYIATLGNIENMGHWEQEANYAKLLRELIKNDGV